MERLQRIEDEICEMKKSNAEVMSALNLILGKLSGVEVGTKKSEEMVEKEEVIDLFGLPAPVEERAEEPVEDAEKEEDTVDNGEAEDLLSGLTDGMVFSY